MEKTQIILWGTTILEPMTALTDILVAIICFYAFYKLKKISKINCYMHIYPYFFLAMGLSTFIGALMTHAFSDFFQNGLEIDAQTLQNMPWAERFQYNKHKLPSWIFNIISVTLFAIAMIYRSTFFFSNKKKIKILYIISAIETIAMLILLIIKLNFVWAMAHIAINLWLLSMPVQIKIWTNHKKPEALIILLATIVTTLTGLVMAPKISLSKWFNYNDISHIIIAISMYIFYIAGLYWHKDFKEYTSQNIPQYVA